ncbi:hypothetical protein [Streptomyces lavenduligriseus]|uniref:Uncharacterized protein n=1 Tax=Streptomyces lavenduligriseus TaxID=67315 RepID=A0ABT0NVV4_9ACTN|nr:hypothetical protein [Streptomyces lavenduligriseus]MCL3995500.1 hypothetical protein [Streptomyces lavenduligriseus]
MLHWNGSWQLSGVTVTADLRAMGTGDVFGMLRADGGTAQVLLIGDEHTYIKADRATGRANGASAEEAAAFGTRWVDDRGTSDPAEASAEGPPVTGEILGLDLAWLAPRTLGNRLSDYSPTDATADVTTGGTTDGTPRPV